MTLTLEEVAHRLGKSVRQVRYMISQNTLQATKVGKRWLIEEASLPLTEAQTSVQTQRSSRLSKKVGKVLAVEERDVTRGYSVQNLRAFQIAQPIYQKALAHLGGEHPAVSYLFASIEQLTIGCHRFSKSDKSAAYRAARDLSARAACSLILSEDSVALGISELLEQELLPAYSGLLKRSEGRLR